MLLGAKTHPCGGTLRRRFGLCHTGLCRIKIGLGAANARLHLLDALLGLLEDRLCPLDLRFDFGDINDGQFLVFLHAVADVNFLPFEKAWHLGEQSDRFVCLNRARLRRDPLDSTGWLNDLHWYRWGRSDFLGACFRFWTADGETGNGRSRNSDARNDDYGPHAPTSQPHGSPQSEFKWVRLY